MDHIEKLICDMTIRNMADSTKTQYVYTVTSLAKYYSGKDLALLSEDEVQRYIYFLCKLHKSSYVNTLVSGLRFFFESTLKRDLRKVHHSLPQEKQKTPRGSQPQRREILAATPTVQQEAYFTILYGAGLRASEGARRTLSDIDSTNSRLWVRQGKGGKDRVVYLAADMLTALRRYYKAFHFTTWIFPGVKHPDQPMGRDRAWSWFDSLKKKTGITKKGGPHLLRHSYATHHLENPSKVSIGQVGITQFGPCQGCGAYLSGANLAKVKNWKDVISWGNTNIYRVRNAPEGFLEYVLANGGIEKPPGHK